MTKIETIAGVRTAPVRIKQRGADGTVREVDGIAIERQKGWPHWWRLVVLTPDPGAMVIGGQVAHPLLDYDSGECVSKLWSESIKAAIPCLLDEALHPGRARWLNEDIAAARHRMRSRLRRAEIKAAREGAK